MKVNGKHYRTVWMEGHEVVMIDQNCLPFEFRIIRLPDYSATCEAIRDMRVRGAGAIGVTAAYAMAQAFLEHQNASSEVLDLARTTIEATRPTARNLFYATEKVHSAGLRSGTDAAVKMAQQIADEDVATSRAIGEHGQALIRDGAGIETHCNAGWLAFADWGTALSPIYCAAEHGKKVFVYVDETRPRSQGARLTAWELSNENIPHTIIPDNAGAWMMSLGKIDLMIVGADRIAANGDVANKIGTLEKAIAAKYYNVPFYVAAPLSTFDLGCNSGKDIPIEERSDEEILFQTGPDDEGKLRRVRVCAPGSGGFNPAFDVSPANLITGIITEFGIIRPSKEEIEKVFAMKSKS
jgi:S-methyl-5-thioribose-1-phosphate isomerase